MVWRWKNRNTAELEKKGSPADTDEEIIDRPAKWSLGILNDKKTDEVPGSVLLLSKVHNHNEPLGLRHTEGRTSSSSLPSSIWSGRSSNHHARPEVKKTADGKIILDPQPDDSPNDPLNWPTWRRDSALLSLGLYCMLGGGMTPILAAGFHDVAHTYDVTEQRVALTTGLYMMGLGIGCVVMSPTAIKFGKRPVYLATAILFALSSVWCALSPNYISLLVARIVQGIAVSPVECLPSATIAEIYFLHERAYRLGVYTLLLLGGKNLVPLVSAAIINSLGWRWVFWIVAMIVMFCFCLLFLFVPETFWDRTPRARKHKHSGHKPSRKDLQERFTRRHSSYANAPAGVMSGAHQGADVESPISPNRQHQKDLHVGFADDAKDLKQHEKKDIDEEKSIQSHVASPQNPSTIPLSPAASGRDSFDAVHQMSPISTRPSHPPRHPSSSSLPPMPPFYTDHYRSAPPKSFISSLAPYSGRLLPGNWFLIAFRPFILILYPSILWSSFVYALSIGWLIVISESMSHIYQARDSYNFTSLQVGLVYISPFIGGILGTVVAGKVSDFVVRAMSKRNDGVYEPEFRLVMAAPIALATAAGLMGFGWSAEERDSFWVPTIFFGIVSFGCALGSTTAITFAVDSYRVYAGEALVTLNFAKNVFHGLVFSLFFPSWLKADGSKDVFIAIGGIHLGVLLFSIPMYIYGKRARMWTVRKAMMEKF